MLAAGAAVVAAGAAEGFAEVVGLALPLAPDLALPLLAVEPASAEQAASKSEREQRYIRMAELVPRRRKHHKPVLLEAVAAGTRARPDGPTWIALELG